MILFGYFKIFIEAVEMKKVIYLILSIVLLLPINKANAKILSVEEVVSTFNETPEIQELISFGSKIEAKYNDANKTIDIYAQTSESLNLEIIASFAYNSSDNYIELNKRSFVVTEDNLFEGFYDTIGIMGIIESIFIQSGYNNLIVKESDYTKTYDTYGLQLEIEHYDNNGNDENGNWNISGDVIKYFKISLDTDKISKLAKDYGEVIEGQDQDEQSTLELILELNKVTNNTVYLHPKVTNAINPGKEITCYVYRSLEKDGIYERVSESAINCLDPNAEFIDSNLKSNTTYYYKAIIIDENKYSNILEVKTGDPSMGDITTNPDTGLASPITLGITLSIGILLLTFILKNKKGVRKI